MLVTLVIRVALFLGILGAVTAGAALSKSDPVGSAFAFAAGPVGLALFGLMFWTAGMTSTIGASFTSGTFLKTLSPFVAKRMLWVGWRRRDLLGGYRSPAWFLGVGVAAWVFTVVAGVLSLTQLPTIFR